MKTLKGKVAAVTGAGSGIGRMLAVNLAKEGCHPAISDINEQGLNETAGMLTGYGVNVTTHVVDVARRGQVEQYADDVVKQHGRVDIIINNAGVAVAETVEDVKYEDFEWVMNINFWGVVYGTKAFLPYLKKQPEGYIVNISSINAMVPFRNNGPYNCAKFAVRGLNETLMMELAGTPVRIMSVHPGGIDTNIARNARFYKAANPALDRAATVNMFGKVARTSPDKAARVIIAGMKKNRQRQLVGLDAHVMAFLKRLSPVDTVKWTGRIMGRMK